MSLLGTLEAHAEVVQGFFMERRGPRGDLEGPQGFDVLHGPGGETGGGGLMRLGTMSTYMATYMGATAACVNMVFHRYMGTLACCLCAILSVRSTSWCGCIAKIVRNFGLTRRRGFASPSPSPPSTGLSSRSTPRLWRMCSPAGPGLGFTSPVHSPPTASASAAPTATAMAV